jgi:CTP synthase (UTP-ammonia lyase)
MTKIALIGDYNPSVIAHQAIPIALTTCGAEGVWIHTTRIMGLSDFDGIWCVPASPYADDEAALGAIRFARENHVPFLGTCGGFQYALIEYARNVCGIAAAGHAETDPNGSELVIAPLVCSLVEKNGEILLDPPGTKIHAAYGAADRIVEGYHCNYGVNPKFEAVLFDEGGPLRATARDTAGDLRAVELVNGHPFFVATLFQPERRALESVAPPLVQAFVRASKA